MKKVILSILLAAVLTWSCGTAFAQGKGKGKGKGGQAKQEKKVQKKEKARQAVA